MSSSDPRRSDTTGRTLDRQPGARHGELALVERDGVLGIISNGVFLMDSSDGRSERLLVRAAVDAAPRSQGLCLLLGGLGVGFSLAEALERPETGEVVVVECEPAVLDWHRTHFAPVVGGSLDDPRVTCEVADLVAWLQRAPTRHFDVICLDVDNGPEWLVGPGNAWLYGDDGLAALRGRLAAGGVLAVWSAHPAPDFQARLQAHFAHVAIVEVPVARGPADLAYVACANRPATR